MNFHAVAPVIGVCGYSKTGKTTLIEKLIGALLGKGLTAAYLKYHSHSIDMDRPGKDTDRAFGAGAAWAGIAADSESAVRASPEALAVERMVELAAEGADIVLVEGFKASPWPKFWLEKEGEKAAGEAVANRIATVVPGAGGGPSAVSRDDVETILGLLLNEASLQVAARPLCGGILIGGSSRRMGSPKALLPFGGGTLAECVFERLRAVSAEIYFLGCGPRPEKLVHLPCLPDAPDYGGPLAGILSAFRHRDRADWLILAVDLPYVTTDYLREIVSRRRPGYRAAIALTPEGHKEPLCALYSPALGRQMLLRARPDQLSIQLLLDRLGVAGDPSLWDPERLKNWNRPGEVARRRAGDEV
jgi:molybdopterin-guanine dinucleotide biosynthesis protein B